MKYIDLNCDMGELPDLIADGTQESLMEFVTSVNIACGGHAGDEETMRQTVEQAVRHKVAVGAHPGYPDFTNFGRIELDLPVDSITDLVFRQVRALGVIAEKKGASVLHVKPHGALYNQAARSRPIAEAIARGVARWRRDLVMVGLAGSPMLGVFAERGFRVAAEAFADRRYEPDGTLRSRRHQDSLLEDPEVAGQQALGIAEHGSVTASNGSTVSIEVHTICIHADTPGAPAIGRAVAERLRSAGITLKHL